MGAIRDFLFPAVEAKRPIAVTDVQAALTPVQISDSVYNILGAAVDLPTINCQLPTCIVDCRPFPSGMYWLVINVGVKMETYKFIKQ